MLVVVRHAKTDSNKNAKGVEKLRGWLPVPLNKAGMQEAQDIADTLEDLKGDVSVVKSGAHPRHVQTAHEIAMALGTAISPMEELNDLNTGDYAGETVTPQLIKELHKYYDDPSKPIPGGESVGNWIGRYLTAARPMVESPETHVLVTSGRSANLMLATAKEKGTYPNMDMMKERPFIDNGGVIIIDPDWNVVYKTEQGKKQAS